MWSSSACPFRYFSCGNGVAEPILKGHDTYRYETGNKPRYGTGILEFRPITICRLAKKQKADWNFLSWELCCCIYSTTFANNYLVFVGFQ